MCQCYIFSLGRKLQGWPLLADSFSCLVASVAQSCYAHVFLVDSEPPKHMFYPFVMFGGKGLTIELHIVTWRYTDFIIPMSLRSDVTRGIAWSGTVFQANTHLDDVYGGFCVFAEAGNLVPPKLCLEPRNPLLSCSPCPIPSLNSPFLDMSI